MVGREAADLAAKLIPLMFNRRENAVLSPYSIQGLLNLVWEGARGRSREQLDRFFKHSGQGYDDATSICLIGKLNRMKQHDSLGQNSYVDVWNSAIVRSPASPRRQYKERLMRVYDGKIEEWDPSEEESLRAIVDRMNAWAMDAGFSDRVFSQQQFSSINLGLVSAIGFQANWRGSNFRERYMDYAFYNIDDPPVSGQMIMGDFQEPRYVEFRKELPEKKRYQVKGPLDVNILELNLSGSELIFTIFQPKGKTPAAFDSMVRELLERNPPERGHHTTLAVVLEQLERDPTSGTHKMLVLLPKFRLENQFKMKGTLSKWIGSIFNLREADLSGMLANSTSSQKFHFEEVEHLAFIEVDKHGVKAGGVTIAGAVSAPMLFTVRIDRPFVFIVRYRTVPLFVGQLVRLPNPNRPFGGPLRRSEARPLFDRPSDSKRNPRG